MRSLTSMANSGVSEVTMWLNIVHLDLRKPLLGQLTKASYSWQKQLLLVLEGAYTGCMAGGSDTGEAEPFSNR